MSIRLITDSTGSTPSEGASALYTKRQSLLRGRSTRDSIANLPLNLISLALLERIQSEVRRISLVFTDQCLSVSMLSKTQTLII